MFWRVIKHDFSLFTNHEKITYPDLQKLNAILDMMDDSESVMNTYFDKQMDELRNRK